MRSTDRQSRIVPASHADSPDWPRLGSYARKSKNNMKREYNYSIERSCFCRWYQQNLIIRIFPQSCDALQTREIVRRDICIHAYNRVPCSKAGQFVSIAVYGALFIMQQYYCCPIPGQYHNLSNFAIKVFLMHLKLRKYVWNKTVQVYSICSNLDTNVPNTWTIISYRELVKSAQKPGQWNVPKLPKPGQWNVSKIKKSVSLLFQRSK